MAGLQKILCKLYSRDSLYYEYALGSQYSKILNISRMLIYQSLTWYIDKILNTPRVLNIPDFSIYEHAEDPSVRHGSKYSSVRMNNS